MLMETVTDQGDEPVEGSFSTARPARRGRVRRFLGMLGPGLITGASDDDPSGIATYSQVGARFGFGMLWTSLFSFPLMAAIQEISARIGRVTGRGLACNIRKCYSPWLVYGTIVPLLIANIINIGADIAAMGAALKLVIGGPALLYAVLFTAICVLPQIWTSYASYACWLKWLSLVLFSYVATVFMVHVPWGKALAGTFVPHITLSHEYLSAVVAVLGTTISPYLFYWQASMESEEIENVPEREPLKDAPQQARAAFKRIRYDTYIGMAFSNMIAFFIILTAAMTLNAKGITHIETSADAAKALEPTGRFAVVLFALGIIGTGLLAVPVMFVMMLMTRNKSVMGQFTRISKPLRVVGWTTTIVMALAAIGMIFA